MSKKKRETNAEKVERLKLERAEQNENSEEYRARQVHLDRLEATIKQRGTPSKYRPEFVRTLLEHMGIKGKSYQSLAFVIGVNPKTLYTWEGRHPEWKEAKELAEVGRLDFLENLLTDMSTGKNKGQPAAAIFYAKNAAPDHFKDKREVGIAGQVTHLIIDTGIPPKKLPGQDPGNIIEAECSEVFSGDDEDLL